jgi:hypothetical protein
MINKTKYVCQTYLKTFLAYPQKTRNNTNKYCSRKCLYQARKLGITKWKPPKKRGRTKPLRFCLVCGKEYYYCKKSQKYCSRKCFEVAHSINMAGKNNPAYTNGSSFNKRCWRGSNWNKIRLEVYKRDNFTCQDCGIKCISKSSSTEETYNNIIQCHHIENYKINHNNKLNNLVTLCLRCHTNRHSPQRKEE